MKHFLLLAIKLYWTLVPASRRRRCIFRQSCSRYVYGVAEREGLWKGLLALRFRFRNCRAGFHLFDDPVDGRRQLVLPGGLLLGEEEIAERFIDHVDLPKDT